MGSCHTPETSVGYWFPEFRYLDVLNMTAFSSCGTRKTSATRIHRGFSLQLMGENLSNDISFTGNSRRTDALSGQGAPMPIYGRPLFGRSLRVVGRKW
jgi:iron complex outermembrane recepter protein